MKYFDLPREGKTMANTHHKNGNGRQHTQPATVSSRVSPQGRVNETKLALLITFLSILVKGKNHYCEPRPDTTIELLRKFHNITIGRRWFFQCMFDLEDAGFMRRQRRWIFQPGPQIESNSSLWWFTLRGAKYLVSKSIRGAQELLRSMADWLHRDDKRRPVAKDLSESGDIIGAEDLRQRIKHLLRDIG